jgi:hypothetical protein
MADLFWRRRLKKQEQAFVRNLPNLPEDLDDNMFISIAAQAGQVDKDSKAYDEFMFSEDGFAKTPYEDNIDEIIELQVARSAEREGRAAVPYRLKLDYFQKRTDDKLRLVEDAEAEVAAVQTLIDQEQSVLRGDSQGEEDTNWRGIAPDTTSRSRHISRRLLEWSVLIVVGLVDAIVAFFSLRGIVGTTEAWYFMAPVIGVQILFPHMTGKSIGALRRRPGDKQERYVLIASVVAWAFYVFAMTQLRYNVMLGYFANSSTEDTPQMKAAIFILSLFLLVGFGLWIMIRAIKSNPHETKFSRLNFILKSKTAKLRRKQRAHAKFLAITKAIQEDLDAVHEQWQVRRDSYLQLAETAKSVYRRALVNSAGEVEFTTKYLPLDKFSMRRPRGN